MKAVVDKNPPNVKGMTPLHLAARHGHIKIVELICSTLTSFVLKPRRIHGHQSILLSKLAGSKSSSFLLAKQLILICLTRMVAHLFTLLAVKTGQMSIVQCLLTEIKNSCPVDENGNSPLHVAEENGQLAILEVLLSEVKNTAPRNRDATHPCILPQLQDI